MYSTLVASCSFVCSFMCAVHEFAQGFQHLIARVFHFWSQVDV